MNRQYNACGISLVLFTAFSMMAILPKPSLAQTNRGVELYNSYDFKNAEQILRKAIMANPVDMEASYYLGLSVLMQDKHEEALGIFMKLLDAKNSAAPQSSAMVPDEYQIRLALARAQLELKQNDAALKNLDAAGRAHTDTADLHVYRGLYYLNIEKRQKAVKELETAIAMDGNNAYAHYYAGHAYLRSGNPSKAVEEFKLFLQLAPMAPEAVKAKALVDALC